MSLVSPQKMFSSPHVNLSLAQELCFDVSPIDSKWIRRAWKLLLPRASSVFRQDIHSQYIQNSEY